MTEELLANVYIKGASDLLQGKIEGMPKIVVIPDNATNGDVVMAMLNPYKICEYKYSVHVYMTEKDFWNGNYQMNLNSDWWYAPYKKEVEER